MEYIVSCWCSFKIDQEKHNIERIYNVRLVPCSYRINYVNIDLRRHYGIFVIEAQTSLLAKHPGDEERIRCFSRLIQK